MKDIEENRYFNFSNKSNQYLLDVRINEINKEKINLVDILLVIEKESINNLKLCINSIYNQTFPFWKLTIVNKDKENKEINEIINSYKEIDNSIDIINNEEEKLNIKNDLIFIVNSKDIIDKTLLECSYWSLKTNTKASICYSNYVLNNNELCNDEFYSNIYYEKNNINRNIMVRNTLFQNDELLSLIINEDNYYNKIFNKMLNKKEYPIRMNFYGSWNIENKNYNLIEEDKTNKDIIEGINYPVGADYWFDIEPYEYEFDYKLINQDNEKKNLLFIFPWLRIGGADKFNYDLISKLDKNKYNITIITTEPCPYIWRQKFEEYAEIFDLTSFLHRKDWSAYIAYILKIRNVNLVLNSNSYYGYYVIPWLKSKFPKVIFTDYLHAVNWNWRNGEYPKDSTAISKILDRTFVASKQIEDVMKNNMGRNSNNTKIVYIGVDSKNFSVNNNEIKLDIQLEATRPIWQNKKVLLFCSRISPEKRPILMINIFNELVKKRNDLVLFVVGDGQELENMKAEAKRFNIEDNIIFFGMKEDVRSFYKIADALVICSIREGITLTTYEALAMSVPVISANVGGQSELINNNVGRLVNNIQKYELGEKSIKYDEEEINRYVKAIEEIIDNKDYNLMKLECRKVIENKFTLDKMVLTMENEFDNMILEGSKVSKDIINNQELYSQYLNLYNEVDRRFYNNPKGGIKKQEETKEDKIAKEKQEQEKQKQEKCKEIINAINERDLRIKSLEEELSKVYNSKRWKYTDKISKIFKFKK